MNLLVKITSLQIRRQLRFTYMSLLNVHDLMCNKPGYCKYFEIDSFNTCGQALLFSPQFLVVAVQRDYILSLLMTEMFLNINLSS